MSAARAATAVDVPATDDPRRIDFALETAPGGGTFRFPAEIVTQKVAILARTGAGKTFAAKRLVEGMLRLGAQVVVLDPVGVWYGLRLAADGETESGLAIPVLGGDHGDLELDDAAGARTAEVLVARRSPAVLDVSTMTGAGQRRFAAAFAERLYELKRQNRSALHVVVEEAQMFAPQRALRGAERMLGAFELLVRLGRNFGIGSTLISQRPQSVHKEVLSQAEVLVLLQLAGAHERVAVEAWINAHGLAARRDVVADLTELDVGEAFVWSPSWLRVLERVRVLPIETYDSSATPELGAAGDAAAESPGRLPALDLAGLAEDLAEEDAEASPRRGRRRGRKPAATASRPAEEAAAVALLEAEERTRLEEVRELRERVSRLEAEARALRARPEEIGVLKRQGVEQLRHLVRVVDDVKASLARWIEAGQLRLADSVPDEELELLAASVGATWGPPRAGDLELARRLGERPPPRRRKAEADAGGGGEPLKAGARRMLGVLAAFHPRPVSRRQLGVLACLTAGGGTFDRYLSTLRSADLVLDLPDRRLELTDAGAAAIDGARTDPPEGAELVALYRARLKAGARRMVDSLVERRGRWTSRDHLARLADLSRGGTFDRYLSSLRSLDLVEERGGELRISEDLWWRSEP